MGSKGTKSNSFDHNLELWEQKPPSPKELLMDNISSVDLRSCQDLASILQDSSSALLQEPSPSPFPLSDLNPALVSAPPNISTRESASPTQSPSSPSPSSPSVVAVAAAKTMTSPRFGLTKPPALRQEPVLSKFVHELQTQSGLPPVSKSPTAYSSSNSNTAGNFISPPGSKRVSIVSPTRPSARAAGAAKPEQEIGMGRRQNSKTLILNPFEDDDYLDETSSTAAFIDESTRNALGMLKRMLPPKGGDSADHHSSFADANGKKVVRSRSFAESLPLATNRLHRSLRGSIPDASSGANASTGDATRPTDSVGISPNASVTAVLADLPKNKGSIYQLQGRLNRSARTSFDRIEGIERITGDQDIKFVNTGDQVSGPGMDRISSNSTELSSDQGEILYSAENRLISPTRNGVRSLAATGGITSPTGMGERNASTISNPGWSSSDLVRGSSCTLDPSQDTMEDRPRQNPQLSFKQQQLRSRSFHGAAVPKSQSVFASSPSASNLGISLRRSEVFRKIGSSSDAGDSEEDENADIQRHQMKLLDECFLQCANQRLVRFSEAKQVMLRNGVHKVAVVFIKQFLNPESVRYFEQSRSFCRASVMSKYKPEDYVVMVLGASPFKFISAFCDNAKLRNVNLGPLPPDYQHDTHASVLADPEQAFYTLVSSMTTDKIITPARTPPLLRAGSSSMLAAAGAGSPSGAEGNVAGGSVPSLTSAGSLVRSDSRQRSLGSIQFQPGSRPASSPVGSLAGSGLQLSSDVSAKRISETFKTASKITDPLFNWSDRPIPSYLLIDLELDRVLGFDMDLHAVSSDRGDASASRQNSVLNKKNIDR